MSKNTILQIPIIPETKSSILEKIKKNLHTSHASFTIVSLNPEILVSSNQNEELKKMLIESDIRLVDGIGITYAGALLGIPTGERISGTDMMEFILQNLDKGSLRVLLLGAKGNLAEKLAQCYSQKYPHLEFKGIAGFEDVKNQTSAEQSRILQIIEEYNPHILFIAYGAPYQELFLARHKEQLKNTVSMVVGGGFDFALGRIPRAPVWMRQIGLEWLFRLIIQPWRWRRQLKLLQFIGLVLRQKIVGAA